MVSEAIKDFRSTVTKYSDRGKETHIAVGVRPSGVIHLGNMATLGLAGVLAQEIGPHLSDIVVTVCDLDLPDSSDWSVKDANYVRYFGSLPDSQKCHDSLLEHATEGLNNFIKGLERAVDIPYNVQLLSQVQRDERFRDGLKRVLDTPNVMKFILSKVPDGKVLVYPLCPECQTSNPWPSEYRDGTLITSCKNPDCSVEDYEMKVNDCSKDLAVHFFIDPLRDRVVPPLCDVHVFGGDYGEQHCCGDQGATSQLLGQEEAAGPIAKIDKVLKVTGIAAQGSVPDIVLGPTFYARDGSKMSKSRNNGLSLDLLRRHFGDQYLERVVGLINHIVEQDYRNVDYKIVERCLFDGRDIE